MKCPNCNEWMSFHTSVSNDIDSDIEGEYFLYMSIFWCNACQTSVVMDSKRIYNEV